MQHLSLLWRWSSMVLRRDDGTSCVSLTCFLMPTAQPSAFVAACFESLPGEHDLEHDGQHAPAGVFSYIGERFQLSSFSIQGGRGTTLSLIMSPAPPVTCAAFTIFNSDTGSRMGSTSLPSCVPYATAETPKRGNEKLSAPKIETYHSYPTSCMWCLD